MIRSMTGYGEASSQVGGSHFFIEVRSLNNKYFKSTIRLPEEFQGLEAEIEQRLREKLTRGTVTVNARCADASESAAYEINTAALARYIEKLKALPGATGAPEANLSVLLSLPGVLQPPTNEEERHERARKAYLSLLDRACVDLIAMREREGRSLRADLEAQGQYIRVRLEKILALAPAVAAEYERRLKARIEAMIKDAEIAVSQVDLVKEIAVYAERTDIAEEVSRLSAHLDQFREMISNSDYRPVGRTLDFLAQEMLRETNTIASKSPDAAISRFAIEIKGAIDRIKEQAANVE